ncbi:MAG: AMP-binding enzyme, partial [Blastocatellia bacterium]
NPVDTVSLRFCVSAGERLPANIYHEWKRLTGLDIVDHIGATEMLQMAVSNRPDRIKPGSAGRPIPGCEVRILDETGAEIVGPGLGELAARSGSAFAGYFNDPERTAVTLKDGWVFTRDMVRRDVDGDYWFQGRADDLFKVKGQWVSPVEVEEALLTCDEVHEVAVVAGTDETGLGSTVAFVVPSPGNAPGRELAELLTGLISSRLPPYKRPSEFRFVDSLPRTATGKIQRFKLREPPGPFVQRSGG